MKALICALAAVGFWTAWTAGRLSGARERVFVDMSAYLRGAGDAIDVTGRRLDQ